MRTLYITISLIVLMALTIPLCSQFAVSRTSPIYTHFTYMFGHANILHWGVNSWCLLMMHHHFNIKRVVFAWVSSIVLSFLYYPTLPTLGASVIISFFLGLTAPLLYLQNKFAFWQTLTLLALGCLLPQIAGLYHIIMFAIGFAYGRAESFFKSANGLNI